MHWPSEMSASLSDSGVKPLLLQEESILVTEPIDSQLCEMFNLTIPKKKHTVHFYV